MIQGKTRLSSDTKKLPNTINGEEIIATSKPETIDIKNITSLVTIDKCVTEEIANKVDINQLKIKNTALKKLQQQLKNKQKGKKSQFTLNLENIKMKNRKPDNKDKENIQPNINKKLIPNTPQTQPEMSTQMEEAPSYSVQTENRYTPLNNITNSMETEAENSDIITELRNRNRGINSSDRSPSSQDHNHQIHNRAQEQMDTHPGDYKHPPSTEANKDQPKKKKEGKPPPLNIIYQSPKDTERLISSQIKQANFTIKRINNNKHVLQMFSLTDFHKAKKLLESVHTCFYTFTPKENKNISVLLKGLHHSYDTQIILNELKSLNIENVSFHKVTQFKTKRSESENIQLPIFLVQLEAGSKIQNVLKIKSLCHHIILWDKLKNKNIIQCKRCQRLGHTASNCNLKYRCVKCNEPHEPEDCNIKENSITDRAKLYCANCKIHGHPASYRGCPILLELKKKHKKKKRIYKKKEKRKY